MNRNILVALDGSPESESILPEIQRISTLKDNVHFLHVVPAFHEPVGLDPQQEIGLQAQALDYLESARERWMPGQPGLNLVDRGEPAQGILRSALERNIHLIAMATHGRRGLGRLLLGSVAAKVVAGAQLPVLVVRPDLKRPSRPVQRILVAVEGEETPRDLLETVKSLAGGSHAEVLLFHAVPPSNDPGPAWTPASHSDARTAPEPRLQGLADALEAEGLTAWPVVSPGLPVDGIVQQAIKHDVDLIALSTHARAGLDRILEGSVAEGVLRRSPVAVLLQKPLVARKPVQQEESHA